MDNKYVQQFKKGSLEMILLSLIGRKETYGYEISEALKDYGFSNISEGTIYPLLLRLEKNQLIKAEYRESPVGPRRKYFSITEAGVIEMNLFLESWTELSYAIDKLFKREKEHE